MNDNQRPNDPLSAAQFGVPALYRTTLTQSLDRSGGDYHPEIGGDYFRVEHVDLPCRVSFNNNDLGQSIPLIPGLCISGNFSGVTFWHANYAGYLAAKPNIVLDIGRGNVINIDNQNSNCGLWYPWASGGFNTLGFVILYPVPLGYKKCDLYFRSLFSNGTVPYAMSCSIRYNHDGFTALSSASFTQVGTNYGGVTVLPITRTIAPVQVNLSQYSYSDSFLNVPIPTGADQIQLAGSFNVAMTSADVLDAALFAK